MKRQKRFMAIDQYGETVHGLRHPRKELLERCGHTKANKQFTDKKDGTPVHTGYVIGNQWWTLYEVTPFERPA